MDSLHFRTFGFAVLRAAFDPEALGAEVDRALREGSRSAFASAVGGGIGGTYVPMMCERTPVSLSLLDDLTEVAAGLLEMPVLPVRAKCVRYSAGAGWHNDSDLDIPSIGFAAYLEPLAVDTGALRVLPGSHRGEFARAVAALVAEPGAATEASVGAIPGVAVATVPGDVIAFDEHLHHASTGGRDRRQWRVDYVGDAGGDDTALRAYYARLYPADWDGGYDATAFPTYGESWQKSGRACLPRLEALGAHAAAAAQEHAFKRGHSAG